MSKSLLTRIATVFLGRSSARLAQFLAFVLLGWMMTPAEFGWYGILTASIVLTSQLCSIGLRQSSAVDLGKGGASSGEIFANLLVVWPGLSLAAAAIVIVITPDTVQAAGFPMIVYLASLGAMAVILMQGVLLGLGKTGAFGLSDSLMPLLLLAGTGLLYLTGQGLPVMVLLIMAGSQLLAGLAAIALALRWSGVSRPAPAGIWPMLRHGFLFSINIFLILLSTRVSLFIVGALLSAEAAGQFFVGQRLADVLGEIAMAAGFVLFSDMVRASDKNAVLQGNVRLASMMLWIFNLAAVLVVLLAAPFVQLTFGAAYSEAIPVLQITAMAIGPIAATKLIYPSLASMGRPGWGTPALLASIAGNITLSLVMVPAWGLVGAAVALVVSQYLLLAGYMLSLNRNCGIPWHGVLTSAFRR